MKRLLLLILLLSGCAQLPKMPQTPASKLDSWRLNGRIAISTRTDSWTANVYWQQQGSSYILRLNAPLGQGAFLLEGNENGVIMRTANNEMFTDRDPDALIAQVLKLEIPVRGLHFWIRGIPAPQPAPQWYTFNKAKHLHRLRQGGWEILYRRYINVQGIDLPNKIHLENERFKVKIVISQWEI